MKKLLLTSMLAMVLALTSNAADQLAFEVQEKEDATLYNLQFHHEQSVKTIWSMRVPLVDGKKPYYGCSLIKWAQNEHGLLALVENNDMWGKLLQFSSNGDLMAELETGGKWVRDFWKGGSIQLEPPDSIEVTSLDGKITKYLVRNGQWADEHGRIFERTPPLQIGKPAPEAEAQKPDTLHPAVSKGVHISTPADMPEAGSQPAAQVHGTASSSPPWPSAVTMVVVTMSAAGLGLLWLLVRKRRGSDTH